MQTSITLAGVLVAGSAILVGQYSADAVPGGGDDGGVAGGTIGADVIVGALPAIAKYGSVGGTAAYALATTSCNIGDEILDWYANNNDHPVIPQNMYVVRDGRLEQIGMSWLKHGFCALQQSLCGPCQPAGGGCPPLLGVGCSDPYSASLNGQQSNLGPRSQVNAATGFFPYPWSAPPAPGTVGRRIQVALDDLDPGLNSGARYFAEGMYISKQDSAAGNSFNNASYREFNVGSFSGGSYNLNLTGPTYQQKPAIFAWQLVHNDVEIGTIDVPNDGRFHVGSRAVDNGDGTWRYSYVVYNLTSDLSAGSFTVAKAANATITNAGFHDIDYHSGEPYDNTDWNVEIGKDAVVWSNGSSFASNPDANALRWNTAYTFWFDSTTPPAEGDLSLGLFKNGETAATTGLVPAGVPPIPGDLDGNGTVNGSDLALILAFWGTDEGDITGDGTTDGADMSIVLGSWGDGG